jgi:hypothetical protein
MGLDAPESRPPLSALASLRQLARPRDRRERCELCDAELVADHSHLVEKARRRLVCACEACALLFSQQGAAKYRRVPRDVRFLADFRLTDEQWEALHLPINLAFFLKQADAERVLALYPSPGGATESLLSLEAWQDLVADNPVLRDLEPDVEALLVNRVGPTCECYRVGIDQCYKLVGLLRTHWKGLSGGPAIWGEIARFFADLKERSGPARGRSHA